VRRFYCPFIYDFELLVFTVCSVFKEIYRAFTSLIFRTLEMLTNFVCVLRLMASDEKKYCSWSTVELSEIWYFCFLVYVEFWNLSGFVFFALLTHLQNYCKFIDIPSSLQPTFIAPHRSSDAYSRR